MKIIIHENHQVFRSNTMACLFLKNLKYSAVYEYSLREMYMHFLKIKHEKRTTFS